MYLRQALFISFITATFLLAVPLTSEWTGQAGQVEAKTLKGKVQSRKVQTRKRKRARRSRKKAFSGHAVNSSKLRDEALDRPSGNLWIGNENLKEELRVNIYDENGEFSDEALAKLDHLFRCRRTHEQRAVDPRLFEMLSRIQDHFEGKQVQLVSGFRFQRNEGSRHYHASAMDIRIAGVNTKRLRAFAETLDKGGMGIGIYPNSGFVHVDFRAPGQPSYRWVDRSGPGRDSTGGKRRSKRAVRRTPNT